MQARTGAGIALATLFAAILCAAVGPAAIARSLGGASLPLLAAALAASVAFFALRGRRWSLLLRTHARVPTTTSAALEAVGWTVSSFVPLKAGDAVRTGWMARRAKAGVGAVAGTVAVERALDVLGLAVAATLALAGLAVVGAPAAPGWFAAALAVAWLLPLAGLAVLVTLALVVPAHRRPGRLLKGVGAGLDALPALAGQPRRLAAVLALSLAVTAAQAATHALLALALLPGADPMAALAAAPLFALTFALPLVPAHVGTYEAGFVAAFAVTGLPVATLVAAAIAAHIASAAMTVLTGSGAAAFLWRTGPSPEAAAATAGGGP